MRTPACLLACLLIALPSFARRGRPEYGRQVVMGAAVINNGGPGAGLSYERLFGSRERFALVVPVAVSIGHVSAHASHGTTAGADQHPAMTVIAPGFRFYPTSAAGVVRYSVSAQLMLGAGKGAGSTYVNGTNELTSRSLFGLLISHTLHIQITPQLRTELALGFGPGSDNDRDNGGPIVWQASWGIGYRW